MIGSADFIDHATEILSRTKRPFLIVTVDGPNFRGRYGVRHDHIAEDAQVLAKVAKGEADRMLGECR